MDRLDRRVADVLRASGISEMLPAQSAAIDAGVLSGESLLLIAPTSSGKTMVGELAAVHQALVQRKTAILVPFKALAEERYTDLQERWSRLNLQVALSTGDYPLFELDQLESGELDVVVFTYERFLALTGRHASARALKQFQTFVVDEVQMVSDRGRGGRLEWVLTFLRRLVPRPQMVALSAVVDDVQGFDTWLGAKCVRCLQRPVPLTELVLFTSGACEGMRYVGHERIAVSQRVQVPGGDLIRLVVHLLQEDSEESVLVFRPTVRDTEETAKSLRHALTFLPPSKSTIAGLATLEQTELNAVLRFCLERSVAFHNSELTPEERRVIENGVRSGEVKCVVSTSTLAMGVNLPAAKTVICGLRRSWTDPPEHYTVAEYRNMAGRAGRLGLTSSGNGTCYVVAQDDTEAAFYLEKYVKGSVEPLSSAYERERLDALVLYSLTLSQPLSGDNLSDLLLDTFAGTLLWRTPKEKTALAESLSGILSALLADGLVEELPEGFRPTELGRLCAVSGVDIPSFVQVAKWVQETEKLDPIGFLASASRTQLLLETRFPGGRAVLRSTSLIAYRILESHNKPQQAELSCLAQALPTRAWDFGVARQARMLATVLRFIDGMGWREIEDSLLVRTGTVRTVVDTYRRLAEIAVAIAELGDRPREDIEALTDLVASLRYGVPPAGQDLARLGVLNRTQVLALLKVGINTPLELLEASERLLGEALGGKDQDGLTKLKLEVMSKLGPLLPAYKSHAGKADGTVLQIIHRVYGSRGYHLERPIHSLLLHCLPELKVKRIRRQSAGEADYCFSTRRGDLGVIALASRNDPTNRVGMNKATQVLQQSPELHPRVWVCLGFPGFDDTAIEKARAHGENVNYKAIAVPDLIEALLRARNDKAELDRVYTAIEEGRGYLQLA